MIQLSVYLEDRPGELANLIKLLMDNKIFIRALTVAKTSEYGLILVLVDNPEKCINILEEKDFLISTTEVIALRLNDHPNALYEIPKTLGDNDINIDYFYSTLVKDESMLILRVEDTIIEEAVEILNKKGFTVVER
ncbi:MAG: acetolactate synthase [Candidatus Hodarchaeota archaeon]